MESKRDYSKEWKWNGRTALITGIGGQDGSYLAESLFEKGYKVRGITRRASSPNTKRVDHLDIFDDVYGKTENSPFFLLYGDLSDSTSIRNILERVRPNEIYNLGAQSHVSVSFDSPESTIEFNALGPLRILEAVRDMKLDAKYYQASSSEMFGISLPPQSEETPMLPQSPYGIAKLAAFHITKMYRNAYGLHATNGILFNHESPRRGVNFATRKITRGLANIVTGQIKGMTLGNLDAKRDWGYAKEYVEAMHLMLQQDKPDDYVVGTEETHTVRDFVEESFSLVGLNWQDFISTSDRYRRPAEVPALLANPTKAREILGWEAKTKFKDLVKIMVASDLKEIMKESGHLSARNMGIMSDDFYIERGKDLAKKLK